MTKRGGVIMNHRQAVKRHKRPPADRKANVRPLVSSFFEIISSCDDCIRPPNPRISDTRPFCFENKQLLNFTFFEKVSKIKNFRLYLYQLFDRGCTLPDQYIPRNHVKYQNYPNSGKFPTDVKFLH